MIPANHSFWLKNLEFHAPWWFDAVGWLVLGIFVSLAIVWNGQRWRSR